MRSYHITEDQFVRGSVYAFAPTRRRLIVALFVLPLLAVPILQGREIDWLQLGLSYYLALIIFMFLLAPAINRWMFRRIYRRNELLHQEQFFEITAGGVHLQSAHGEARYTFAELKKVGVFPEMVLIYPMTTLFHMLPRDQLTEAEVELLARCGQA